jgi:hypothetical protein
MKPNPTEKCRKRRRMKGSPHKRKRQPTTEEHIRVAITKEWEALPQD